MRRTLWLVLGYIALALGLIGVPVPLLPTTPFLLLALFCFGRSSERLHRWLLEHPRFGPSLRDWQQHGVIRARAKGIACALLALSVILPIVFFNAPWWARLASGIVAVVVAAFILSRPSQPVSSDQIEKESL